MPEKHLFWTGSPQLHSSYLILVPCMAKYLSHILKKIEKKIFFLQILIKNIVYRLSSIRKVLYTESPIYRLSYILIVLYTDCPIYRKSYIPKVQMDCPIYRSSSIPKVRLPRWFRLAAEKYTSRDHQHLQFPIKSRVWALGSWDETV